MRMADVAATPKPVLFTKSNAVTISNDRNIECKHDESLIWCQVGVDHILDKNKRTKWTIKMIRTTDNCHLMIGVCSKGVLQSFKHTGHYMYGWVYGNAGHQWHAGNHQMYQNQSDNFNTKGYLRWANDDEISIEFHDYKLNLFINDVKVHEWIMQRYPKLHEIDLYPVLCIRQGEAEFLGLTEQ